MTYWDRICKAAQFHRDSQHSQIQRKRPIVPSEINKIEIWSVDTAGELHTRTIIGADQACEFLSTYSSFEEVEASLQIAGTIDHISCVNVIDDFNAQHSGIEYPASVTDRGTMEVFYREGPSQEERYIAEHRT
jgi:hypothetical protein